MQPTSGTMGAMIIVTLSCLWKFVEPGSIVHPGGKGESDTGGRKFCSERYRARTRRAKEGMNRTSPCNLMSYNGHPVYCEQAIVKLWIIQRQEPLANLQCSQYTMVILAVYVCFI